MKKDNKKIIKIVVYTVLIGLIGYYLFATIILWKYPVFSSTNEIGITKKAIEQQNPELCDKLASNVLDSNPRKNCYHNSIISLNNTLLCTKYGNKIYGGSDYCMMSIAENINNLSICNFAGWYQNPCIVKVATKNKNFTICQYINNDSKTAIKTTEDCLLDTIDEIIKDSTIEPSTKDTTYEIRKDINQSTKDTIYEYKYICDKMINITKKDWCNIEVSLGSNNISLCNELFDDALRNKCIAGNNILSR